MRKKLFYIDSDAICKELEFSHSPHPCFLVCFSRTTLPTTLQ